MKTIGIDCRFAPTESGLGRYTRELVAHLLERGDPWRYALIVRNPKEDWIAKLSAQHSKLIVADFRHYSLAEQIRFPRLIKDSAIDLLFSPHFNVPLRCPVPFVVTIHDLILHRYPNEASLLKRLAYRGVMRHAVRKARHVIAVSEFSAGEICSVYGAGMRSKVSVVHEGVGPLFHRRPSDECASARKKYGLPEAFFLYVGNAKQHKNVQTLIDAFASVADPSLQLVLVTGGKEAANLRLCDRVLLLPRVAEEDLPALYSSARAFVTASLYEGFCLPVAEAAACGCPIIASDRGAIPEVAPQGSRLVAPTVEDLMLAMTGSLPSPTPSPAPQWSRTAEQTAGVLRHAIGV